LQDVMEKRQLAEVYMSVILQKCICLLSFIVSATVEGTHQITEDLQKSIYVSFSDHLNYVSNYF